MTKIDMHNKRAAGPSARWELAPGMWYQVSWCDAVVCANESSDDANIAFRTLVVRFARWEERAYEHCMPTRYAVFEMLEEEQEDHSRDQVGWWAIPEGMLVDIRVVAQGPSVDQEE